MIVKKLLGTVLILAYLELCISCLSKTLLVDPVGTSSSQFSYSISLDDIETYLSGYKNIKNTKGEEIKIEPILEGSDTVLYLINYADGWEVLSADKRAPRVFAMSKEGNISPEELISIPAAKVIFDNFVDNILYLKHHPELELEQSFLESWFDILSPLRDSPDWILVNTTVVDSWEMKNHLTETRWGQGSPWNCRAPFTSSSFIEHCLTGCVPVAAAQLLYYLHYKIGVPLYAYGESSTSAFIPANSDYLVLNDSDIVFDSSLYSSSVWDSMSLTSSSAGSSDAAVSTLMVQIGLYIGAKYYINSTLAYFSLVKDAFVNQFAINCSSSGPESLSIVVDQILEDEMPSFLGISRHDIYGNRLSGHGVVADAAQKQIRTEIREYVSTFEQLDGTHLHRFESSSEIISTYVGINWGWDGAYMFSGLLPIFYNTEAISWITGGYNWDTIEYIIYNFSSQSSI